MSFSLQVSSLQQQHGKQLLACLDKLERAVYNAAVRCTRNDALADRAVTQMELQLMSLREERDWLKQQNYRVEAQQLENEAQWSENWNKIQTMERELMERNAENRDLESQLQSQGEKLRKLEEEVKEKDDENRQLQQSVRSLAEQVNELSSWKAQSRAEFHNTLWGNKRLTEELKEANRIIETLRKEKEQLVQDKASLWEKISELETKWQLETKEWEGKQKQWEEELERRKTSDKEKSLELEQKQEEIRNLERKLLEANQHMENLKESSKREKEEMKRLYQSFLEQRKDVAPYDTAEEQGETSPSSFARRGGSLKRPRYREEEEEEESASLAELHTQDLLQSILHELEEHAPQLEVQRKELERALQNERELVMQLERSRVEMDKLRASNKYLEEQRHVLVSQIQELKEKKQTLERRMLLALREKDMNSEDTLNSNFQSLVQKLKQLAEEADENRTLHSRVATPLTVSRSLFQTPSSGRSSSVNRGGSWSSLKWLAQEVKELLERQETLITTLIQQKDLYKSLVEEEVLKQSGC